MSQNNTFQFSLMLSGVDANTSGLEDVLYEAGCDDALLNFKNGTAYLDFDREAANFEEAIISAIKDVESASVKPIVNSVGPSYLVNLSEIARRVKLTKQFISLLTSGARGDGTFPKPMLGIDDMSTLWRWKEVAGWLFEKGYMKDKNKIHAASVIDDINVALEFRPLDNKTAQHRQAILEALKPSS